MADKLDRFTHHARHTLARAQESALRLNHDEIRPEHLLIALDLEQGSIAEAVLQQIGVAPGQIRHAFEHMTAHEERQLSRAPQLAELTKRVIVLAVEEVSRMESQRITTAHLLLGLLRQEESTAFAVLQTLGIHADAVRTLTLQAMQQREIPEVQEIPRAEAENDEDRESGTPSAPG